MLEDRVAKIIRESEEGAKDFQNLYKDYWSTTQILIEDYRTTSDYLQKNIADFWFRAYVRTFFALVEGTIFGSVPYLP